MPEEINKQRISAGCFGAFSNLELFWKFSQGILLRVPHVADFQGWELFLGVTCRVALWDERKKRGEEPEQKL